MSGFQTFQIIILLAVVGFSGFILFRALGTGTMSLPGQRPRRRRDHPAKFWQALAFEAAVFLIFSVLLVQQLADLITAP